MIAMARVRNIYDENDMFAYAVKETENAAKRMQAIAETGYLEEYDSTDSSSDVIPEGRVSLLGLDAMISRFLGVIGEYSRSDIEDIFDAVDTDRSEFIDRAEFSAFLRVASCETESETAYTRSTRDLFATMVGFTNMETALSTSMRNSSRPRLLTGDPSHHLPNSQRHDSVFGDSNTIEYMNKLMNDSGSEKPLEEWSMFYCGSSNAIVKDLKAISKRYDIDLAVEKFDW